VITIVAGLGRGVPGAWHLEAIGSQAPSAALSRSMPLYQFSDGFVTRDWTDPTAKEAVNQFVGSVSAAYRYAFLQKTADRAVSALDSSIASGSLARAAPIVNLARSLWNAGRIDGDRRSNFMGSPLAPLSRATTLSLPGNNVAGG
jgi:hypothetical protein